MRNLTKAEQTQRARYLVKRELLLDTSRFEPASWCETFLFHPIIDECFGCGKRVGDPMLTKSGLVTRLRRNHFQIDHGGCVDKTFSNIWKSYTTTDNGKAWLSEHQFKDWGMSEYELEQDWIAHHDNLWEPQLLCIDCHKDKTKWERDRKSGLWISKARMPQMV